MKKYSILLVIFVSLIIVGLLVIFLRSPAGEDWPMWGYDEGRTFSLDMQLPHQPELYWVRQFPEPKRAWPFQYEDYYTRSVHSVFGKLSFDVSYEPVIGGGRMYVSSMVSDKVSAYATDTGEELWRYYTDGPVRFAPAYRDGKLYFTSDDGYLYCLRARSGRLLWKYKGSYADRKVLGNERIISIWPARGGPVVSDGVVYFASGILSFEGIFVHAVDADTGESLWTNSSSGAIWSNDQYGNSYGHDGPVPQGYLAVSGDKLIVPGGRTPPAVYDRQTGELLYFRMVSSKVGKGAGGYRVHTRGDWFFNHGMLYSLKDGAQFGPVPGSVLTEELFIGVADNDIVAHSSTIFRKEVEIEDRLQQQAIREEYEIEHLWSQSDLEGFRHVHFRSGSHLGFSRDGGRAGLYRLDKAGRPEAIVWEQTFEGEIWNMIPADDKLFVVTEAGKVYCYGEAGNGEPAAYWHDETSFEIPGMQEMKVRSILMETKARDGYGFVFGGESGLVKALADQTEMHLVAVYEDEREADRARLRFDDAGLYGQRIAVLPGGLEELRLPPYLAELVIMKGDDYNAGQISSIYELLRPYGGKLIVPDADENLAEMLADPDLENGKLERNGNMAVLTREGALSGSGQWTHQYGDVSNRTYSDEERVKPPLGTLWFGGPSNLNILPRHSSGPVPQVVAGRLYILGVETISARCVYTGRELWVKELPGIGHPFTDLEDEERFFAGNEVYMTNMPGANVMGSPYVSLKDGIYVIHNERLLHLDPATGETISVFELPELNPLERNEWGHIMAWEDLLITTIDPHVFASGGPGDPETWWNATSSSWLVVMNRNDGQVLWSRKAEREGYRHNAITAGNGRLYVIDGLSEGALDMLQRRGLQPERGSVLTAFDICTGEKLWEDDDAIFGTWLGYYEDRDLLLEGGRRGGKRDLPDEPRSNLVARSGETGTFVWQYQNRYSGSLGLHSNMIIPGNHGENFIDPESGDVFEMPNPITGVPQPQMYIKGGRSCGTMNSSKYLITHRSGAAAYTDLLNYGGTANLGGFRAGCTNNLVAADGVLNAPDYTRTCTCAWQLQTSLGFIHMPDVEMWTFNLLPEINTTVESIGINFGAPGDRRENGVLWLEYPKVYEAGSRFTGRGPTPVAPVTIASNSEEWFRNHATWIENSGEEYSWVASYGGKGIEHVSLELVQSDTGGNHTYDVTLYFAEPDDVGAGERVFDLLVQGEQVIDNFDIAERSGGPRRVHSVELKHISVVKNLEVDLVKKEGSLPPVLSGIKVILTE